VFRVQCSGFRDQSSEFRRGKGWHPLLIVAGMLNQREGMLSLVKNEFIVSLLPKKIPAFPCLS
jgi:hypothetical protein